MSGRDWRRVLAGALSLFFFGTVLVARAQDQAASGFVFQDAVAILKARNQDDMATVNKLLAAYHITLPAPASQNPFIAEVTFLNGRSVLKDTSVGKVQGAQGGSSSTSIFSATNVANALGTIIAERVKQDAEILALEALSTQIQQLNDSKKEQRYSAALGHLLPATIKYLEKFNPSAADPGMWSILQADFRQDLQALPTNLPGFFESLNPPDKPLPFERYFVVMAAEFAAQMVLNNKRPYAVIDGLAQTSSDLYKRQSDQRVTRLTLFEASEGPGVVSAAAGNTLTARGRAEEAQLQNDIANDTRITADDKAAAEARQRAEQDLTLHSGMYTELHAWDTVVPQFQQADAVIQGLAIVSHAVAQDPNGKWHTLDQLRDYLQTQVTDPGARPKDPRQQVAGSEHDPLYLLLALSYATDKARYLAIEASVSPGQALPTVPQKVVSWVKGNLGKLESLDDQTAPVMVVLAKIQADLVPLQDTLKKDYQLTDLQPLITDLGGLATDVCTTIETIGGTTVPDPYIKQIQLWENNLYTLTRVTTSAHAGDYPAVIAGLVAVLPDILPGEADPNKTPQPGILVFIQRQGPLIASLAAATKPEDFTAALDQYALPAGSFTQVQNEKNSWTINAYFGGEIGGELLSGNLSNTTAHRLAPRVGFSAPVGIAYNWGYPSTTSQWLDSGWHRGSQSVFFSALDVGAVASFRLQSGNGGQVAAIKWSNIVAPGLFYVWTLRNTPLSFMVGTQYGPELRQVSTTNGNTLERAAWQPLVLGVTFNIPLFQLSGGNTSGSSK